MFGWVSFIVRDLLLKKYHKWGEVCEVLCIPSSTTFTRDSSFHDASTMSLVQAASKVLNMKVDDLLEVIGEYFMIFVREDGYEETLRCLGDSLQEWLSNINILQIHLEHAFEMGKESPKHHAPLFWSTIDPAAKEANTNTIMLHYQSIDGSLMAPMVEGMIREVARGFFKTSITFERVVTEGVNGSKFTSWKLHGDKPLAASSGRSSNSHAVMSEAATRHWKSMDQSLPTVEEIDHEVSCDLSDEEDESDNEHGRGFAIRNAPSSAALQHSLSAPSLNAQFADSPTLSNRQMKELFPFCIVFDQKMVISDCGHSLVEILGRSAVGESLSAVLNVNKPAGEVDTWSNFLQLYKVANNFSSEVKNCNGSILKLNGIISLSDDCRTGFYMCHADIRSFQEMKNASLRPRHLSTQAFGIEYLLQEEQMLAASRDLMKLKNEVDRQTALAAKLRKEIGIQGTKLATQSLQNRRTFVRYIGHEIRTPLTVVKLGLKLALADARTLGASEDFINNISDCEDSVDVAVAILNDLLAYEKLDSGILEMFKEIIVVVPFVIRSLRPFVKQAEAKGITMTIENNCVENMNSLAIYADQAKMNQVIRNFISNAIKFTPMNGQVTICISVLSPTQERRRSMSETSLKKTLEVEREKIKSKTSPPSLRKSVLRKTHDAPSPSNIGSSPNDEEPRFMRCTSADCLLSMSTSKPAEFKTIKSVFDNAEFQLLEQVLLVEFIDSGKGISEENQKKLFRENVQFNPHVTQEGGGSGLGLWISNGIVKLHNGYVAVRSNPDGQPGVTFSLQLPIYQKASLQLSHYEALSRSVSLGDEHRLSDSSQPMYVDDDCSVQSLDVSCHDFNDAEDLDEDDVVITTNTLSDLRMDIDNSLDEKVFLNALLSDKEKRLARKELAQKSTEESTKESVTSHQSTQQSAQQSVPSTSATIAQTSDVDSNVRVLKQSHYNTSEGSHRAKELGPLYGCRVLLVDDSKLILRVTSATLKSLGVECDSALDGEKAIEKIRNCCLKPAVLSEEDVEKEIELNSTRKRSRSGSVVDEVECPKVTGSSGTPPPYCWDINYYDLVLLDKQMPVMDGLKTCELLRSMGYNGMIVGVTGSCMPSEVDEFRKAGIDEVFSKPLDFNQLESYYAKVRMERTRVLSR
mmetsp:Transcript_953/g.2067  ORF Transcript_953/g.2067 Transcript_953/m.2067 type:complete len:1145 (-) Transcript_953:360-3794(-)